MILPGLISLAFYKRSPSMGQVLLGLLATVVLSAVLGYYSPGGPLGVEGSVILAIVGAVLIYAVILAYLHYRYYPRHSKLPVSTPPAVPP